MDDLAKEIPPQPQDMSTHPAGFHHPLSSDAQTQPGSIYLIFGKIYTLRNE